MQTPHFTATRRDGCRDTVSEAWGAGAAAGVPHFTMFLVAACAPSRTTLRETESGAPFRAVCFIAWLAKGDGHWDAPRFVHPIPESHRRNRVGLNQRFLS